MKRKISALLLTLVLVVASISALAIMTDASAPTPELDIAYCNLSFRDSVCIKYAVSYGPALIINGEPCNANRSLGGGINPRTAIGQREDGAILLLVVNGRQIDSRGATLDDIIEIMLSFGAVNASNLDGGSSTLMKLDGEYLNTSSYILGGERVLASTILISP